jgi:hypothetical protein
MEPAIGPVKYRWIKNLNVGKTALSDFKSTTNGDSIVVIYMISAQETIDLERIAREPARNPGPSVNALPESEVRLRRVGVETQGNFRFGTRFFCE